MKPTWLIMPGILCGIVAVLGITVALRAEPFGDETNPSKDAKPAAAEAQDDEDRVSVVVARDRAKLMHNIYSATLDVMHHRYFHRERAIVPARALEDVFAEIKSQSKAEAKWIAVNTKAMSVNHEPNTDFEKKAAKEIAAGKPEFEVVEDGYYRRAGAIPLANSCINCHDGFFREHSKTPKFAGLVISVPVKSVTEKAK